MARVSVPPRMNCPRLTLSRWGQPFLDHTFLYHLTRLDHRHNFSPYFYPIYLSFWPDSPDIPSHPLILLARHPLASFVPQFGIVALAGFLLPSRTSLSFTMFVQTATFVAFNKVCTSQVSSFCGVLSALTD